ncbi:SPOR domain-containing protein [Xanthomonas campestris pv. campestris]|uniref:SPOR domain-containing protein n=1 Tax=Xanthomonas campestris pv. campestris (strain B100) TaxID=509169 RepID=B0RXM7_XANCB|nr:SPOR domain-containing protein [Xanthomonas campestris]MCD0252546.1 SPOR domain-containing protein [Xanthomonas campestris pv. campestris]MDO0844185.1 SPOR domain-containing protein [Xanthomonas campestris pv. campestris]MEA0622577.1 SPOR domain-containing protein [Xanthomonas campestris pv. campestris]MEA0626795.1 SPOR domain-containing protein [Xanthomonas campestris pv. campestris]MEA0647303.1 SPOR domain-containing protein [Xanthomonas campestris pv. campestris]
MAARRGKSQARRNTSNGTPGWVWLVAGAAIAAVIFLAAPNLFKKDGDGFLRVGPRPNPDAQPAPVADTDVDTPAELPKPSAPPAKPAVKPGDAQTQYDFYTLLPGKEVQMSDAELAASARAEEAARARAALEGKPVAPAASVAAATPTTSVPMPLNETAASAPKPLPETAPARPAATPPPASTAAVTTPAAASAAKPAASAATAPAVADTTRYILQAGSFGASGDAESTKAKLAMMGLAARVESADIAGRTVYRVRMGPYGSAGELAEAKQKLTGSGLPAIAIKAQ